MKILRRLAIGLVILVVAGMVVVKVFVGAINVPITRSGGDAGGSAAHITLPPGFQASVFAKGIRGPRVLRFSRAGDLLVSVPGHDEIILVHKGNSRVLLDRKRVADLKDPHGLDFYQDAQKQDWLYVAESESIGRIRFDHNKGSIVGHYERVVSDLPGGGNHWKKTLRFGPDGLLYVMLGSSCNACIEKDKRRATLMRFRPDGSAGEIYASGLRNSEGFDWSPRDGALYATDNGRDMLGDDFPPCELNKIVQGGFYGWPYANGDRIADPDQGQGYEVEIAASIAPVHGFRAHNAPLGMTFIRHDKAAEAYRGAALVALHGSWNRSRKDGYKVVSLHWRDNGRIEEKDFASGFLRDDNVAGRPADVIEGPDGAIYISDDFADVVYRVTYTAVE